VVEYEDDEDEEFGVFPIGVSETLVVLFVIGLVLFSGLESTLSDVVAEEVVVIGLVVIGLVVIVIDLGAVSSLAKTNNILGGITSVSEAITLVDGLGG